jgi:hypothetical protein
MHRRLWTAAKVAAAFPAVTGLALGILGLIGPPWPTEPVFLPGPPSFGAAFDVPFHVENKSLFFWLSGLRIKCKVEGIIPDQPSVTGITFGPNFVGANGTNGIAPSSSAPFTCPLRGAFGFGNKDSTDIIRNARVTFMSEHDARFFGGPVKTEDGPFTWITTTIPPHWERGVPLK